MKICSKCEILQPLENFHKDRTARDGHVAQCKACRKTITKEYNSRPEVKARISQYGKQKREDPKWLEQKKQYDREYYQIEENQTKIKSRAARREKDPNGRRQINSRRVQRKAEDPQFKMAVNLRGRLGAAVKNNSKAGSAVRDLGCTILELRSYLESKFQLGMTWENWGKGKGKWNIDHIMPLAAFDLTNRQHAILACYYLNLQPLWFEENLTKHSKLPGTKQ
jgi:hypothetical protein